MAMSQPASDPHLALESSRLAIGFFSWTFSHSLSSFTR
jgi:hypothetical protein